LLESPLNGPASARFEQPGRPEEANFFLAVCSNEPVDTRSFVYVPRAANVLKERAEHIRRLESELATKNHWLEKSQAEHAALVALHDMQNTELRANNHWAKELDNKLTASMNRILDLQRELEEQQHSAAEALQQTQQDVEARTQWALSLEQQTVKCGDELARCVALLDQAEATVVERTHWAQESQRQLDATRLALSGSKASLWLKLGRAIGLVPELPF
jgi:hypothetical protein